MSEAFEEVAGDGAAGLLIVVDHASSHVPEDIGLGIHPDLASKHIGWDIGAASLGRALCTRFQCPGLLGTVSRLVIDLHRDPDSPALIPTASDGYAIPGNVGLVPADRRARIARFWDPYHQKLAGLVTRHRPRLIVSVHSFTPRLESAAGPTRPWEIGILYNEDDRAARIALRLLRESGVVVGDNEPYSGRILNYTMNRHAERNRLPYLAIEVRNDMISADRGLALWAEQLGGMIELCCNELA